MDSYFESERFLTVAYWEIKWKVRQYHYFMFMKFTIEDPDYEKLKVPKVAVNKQ